jgi:hypothetical protein
MAPVIHQPPAPSQTALRTFAAAQSAINTWCDQANVHA